jgi:hypothetical protein
VAFNGSGTFSLVAGNPVVTGTTISSTWANNTLSDIASNGLTVCLTKDGQTTPTANLNFGGFRITNVGITAIAGSVGTPSINLSDTATGFYRSAADQIGISVNGTQRGFFSSTGLNNAAVGATTPSTGAFTALSATGNVTLLSNNSYILTNTSDGSDTYQIGMVGGGSASINRGALVLVSGNEHATTPGDLDLYAGNVAGGSINLYTGAGVLTAAVSSTGLAVTGELIAGANNTHDIGNGSVRWREIFATNGTINTSDARLKTTPRALADAERAAALEIKASIGLWQWLDAIEKKGDAARLHTGPTVQKCIEILESHGLDPFRYSFICHDAWEKEVRERPAIEARAATEAQPAEYETRTEETTAIVDGKKTTIRREYLYCVKDAVPAQPAVEAADAWTETVREAGDVYSLRKDELSMFLLATA